MDDPIATRRLICIRQSGEEIVLTMSVGRPCIESGTMRCPVSLDPIHPRLPSVAGEDSWQALQLAMRLVERFLQFEIEKGNELFWIETDGSRSAERFDFVSIRHAFLAIVYDAIRGPVFAASHLWIHVRSP